MTKRVRTLAFLLPCLLLGSSGFAQTSGILNGQSGSVAKSLWRPCTAGQTLVKDTSQPYGVACADGGGGGVDLSGTTSGDILTNLAGAIGASSNVIATPNTVTFKSQLSDLNGAGYTPTLAGGGAGNLSNGVYSYKFTLEDYGGGQTACGTATPTVTVADATMNGKIAVAVPYIDNTFWPVLNIYRTAAGGSTYKLVERREYQGDVVYTDNTADASLGATCPTTNTTLNTRLTVTGSVISVPYSTLYDDLMWELAPRNNTHSIMMHGNDVDSGNAPPILFDAGSSGNGQGGSASLRGGNGRGSGNGGLVLLTGGWSLDSGNGGDILIAGGPAFGSGTGGRIMVMTSVGQNTATFADDKSITFDTLKTTGAATGKKVVCVDTATGKLYASSTGTDCSN